MLSHVLLGDLVSVYLAALEGVDPTPVEAIERLKQDSTDTDAIGPAQPAEPAASARDKP